MRKSKRAPDEPRQQVAAMPIRWLADGSIEIMLVTSRTTRRWIVPKGWPIKGMKDYDAAAREAFEEAGVVGTIAKRVIGRYDYWKRLPDNFVLCTVKLYVLDVQRQLPSWAEQGQRRCQWFKPQDAADLVDEPGLRSLINKVSDIVAHQRAG